MPLSSPRTNATGGVVITRRCTRGNMRRMPCPATIVGLTAQRSAAARLAVLRAGNAAVVVGRRRGSGTELGNASASGAAAAWPGTGSASARKMRKIPAASGDDACRPASPRLRRYRLGAASGEVRKAPSWSMLARAMRCSIASSAAAQASRMLAWRGFRAADAQCAVAVIVEHIPDPRNRGLRLRHHFGSEIAAHAVGGRAFARNHRAAGALAPRC